ncbi:type II secretion system minor pseudopilin GspH [Aliiglaciecola sp. LCG003]|uniref:type II secretion system minor pseudopilin GspH n=1 Tax=Aliiglaciecola sp. LCG003 TaxID=3053655 RepID=UPI00257458D7|nr:type II secretion system minor pseudopilin GspH [Aliiglaciecola sp. LCG003]WJG09299.1 type II secretion system minor pseudopilin GspH [Aliiglaciecola sp. LCG003]
MTKLTRALNQQRGFTLIEIMAVLAIMGLVVSLVTFRNFGTSAAEDLDKQAKRFQVVVDMASDFAVLNQQELGIRIEPKTNEYLFMWLDDEQNWQLLEGEKVFSAYQLPEKFKLELELEDLPWVEEDNLFSDGVFNETLSFDQNRVEIGQDETNKKLPPPQIMLLSSGDITPFSLLMMYEPDFSEDDPVYYKLNALDSAPIERLGPLRNPDE